MEGIIPSLFKTNPEWEFAGMFYDYGSGLRKEKRNGLDTLTIIQSLKAIVTAEVFDRVQEEMNRRARLVYKADGTVETSSSKYNWNYILSNLIVCGDCGASYRRRTERGKVVWR